MRENRMYGSMRGGGGKMGLTTTVGLTREYHPAYSTGTKRTNEGKEDRCPTSFCIAAFAPLA